MSGLRAGVARARSAGSETLHSPGPAKASRTQQLVRAAPPSNGGGGGAAASEVVQADGGGLALDDPFAVHLTAERGVSGSGGRLPHLAEIQASFGRHDVGGVQAHVGGTATEAAAALGSGAYATGNRVGFAAEPDLRQAAHEAAHVVQQRGGVQLDGGVGKGGDRYEQHADAVAAAVVRGESAEPLLDDLSGGGGGGATAVQRDGETCEAPAEDVAECAPDPAADRCSPDGEREAEAVEAIRSGLPEVAAAEPALRSYTPELVAETRTRFAIPERGWRDVRAADGVARTIDLSRSLRDLIDRVSRDRSVIAHIRRTLDMFYNDPDPRTRLAPGDIDVPLVLAIASRESAGRHDRLFSTEGDRRVVTAGPDTHRDGIGGLDYVGDRRFPSEIRDEVTEAQDSPRLRAGLRPGRSSANPVELPADDLLAAYVVEVHAREQRFERQYRDQADSFLSAEQVEQLWHTQHTDARRAWVQASFGSRLDDLLRDVLRRFRTAMRGEGGFAAALADDNVNLNAIITSAAVIDAAGLSGHRTRVTAAEAAMLDETLPADLARGEGTGGASGGGSDGPMCGPEGPATTCSPERADPVACEVDGG